MIWTRSRRSFGTPSLGTLGGLRRRGGRCRSRRCGGRRRRYRRPCRLAGGGGGLIGCRHAASIAIGSDARNDEDGNDRGNPNRTAAGGRLSIGVGPTIFEAWVRHIEFSFGLCMRRVVPAR